MEKVKKYSKEAKEGRWAQANDDVAFILGLLAWFKKDFFSWVNKPKCALCGLGGARMEAVGITGKKSTPKNTEKPLFALRKKYINFLSPPSASPFLSPLKKFKKISAPTPEESRGWASRVELYRCTSCHPPSQGNSLTPNPLPLSQGTPLTRFPRYNEPRTLLGTRKGRCGEWALAFTLILRACDVDGRYVLDFTDHVWCEAWIPSLKRYVHVDPCEKRLDTPLMYEKG